MRKSHIVVPTLLASNLLFAFLLLQEREEDALPNVDSSEEISKLAAKTLASESPVLASDNSIYPSTIESLEETNSLLKKEVAELKNELSVYNARRQRPSVSRGGARFGGSRDAMMEMLQDEETAELALEWIRSDQSNRFASLIALSGIQGGDKASLIDLLTDRYAHRTDLNQFGTDALPEEERLSIEAAYRQELSSLVGDGMAEMFLKAETKPLSFTRIQEIDTHLHFADQPLTQEQYLPIWNLLSNTIQVGVRFSDPASVAAVMERSVDNNLDMLEEARQILTPDQFDVFEERIFSDITQTRVRGHFMAKSLEQRAESKRVETNPEG